MQFPKGLDLVRISTLSIGFAVACAAAFAGSARADVSQGVSLLEAGDVSGAADAFAAAYEAGDGDGAFYLGRLFELGLGTDRDEVRAAGLFAAAAERGSARGQLRLGLLHHEGRVLLRDYVEGTRLICAAADAGLAEAQLNCGLAHQAGRGVAADAGRARTYWEMAAAQGNVAALNVLGTTALEAGETAVAAERFQASAEAGNAFGMLSYARLLETAEEPDHTGAYAWSSLAVVRGLAEAIDYRESLEAQMDAEDVLAGQAQARAWTEARIAAASDAAE